MTPADKQEPVAWMYERPNHNYPALGPHRVLNPVRWSEEAVAEGWTETPLYTRPTPDLAERIEGLVEAAKYCADELEAFARHREYGYHQGYYDGRTMTEAETVAKIVAWLREQDKRSVDDDDTANAIEAGDYKQ